LLSPVAVGSRSSGRTPSVTCPVASTCPTVKANPLGMVKVSPVSSPSTRFIFGLPTNAATNVSSGLLYTSNGVPCCAVRPSRITTIRSDRVIASSWSCVT
jgi:hypothetical protein